MPDSFLTFIVLLVIAILVSAVLHYGLRFYATPGLPSFLSKVAVAYMGAMMGTPVFGAWFSGLAVGSVYLMPAILGALAVLVLAVDVAKMVMRH